MPRAGVSSERTEHMVVPPRTSCPATGNNGARFAGVQSGRYLSR